MRCSYFIVFVLLFSSVTNANDSIGRVAVGGIVFKSTRDIEMASEVLEMSVAEIKVSYVFNNHSDKDITETILFPLPLKHFYYDIENYSPFYAGSFYVASNGEEVKTILVQRALLNGRDVTEELRQLGLADAMIFDFEGCELDDDVLCKVTEEQGQGLKKLGITADALWQVQEVIKWRQTFPANSEIKVEHFYTPSVGGELYYLPGVSGSGAEGVGDMFNDAHSDVCMDESTSRAIERRVEKLYKAGASVVRTYVADVEYILTTAKNWRGPIGDFTLRLKKSLSDEIISLCFPGKPVKKDALTYEFHQKHFIPENDVVVKFFSFIAAD